MYEKKRGGGADPYAARAPVMVYRSVPITEDVPRKACVGEGRKTTKIAIARTILDPRILYP
jgi:hypothetical protein